MGKLLFINRGRFTLQPGQKVLKAADYAVHLEAEAVLAKAREEAEKTAAVAKEAFEAEKKRGYASGIAEGKMEISERMLDSIAAGVDYLAGLENTIVDLVINSTSRVIEGLSDKERVLGIVRKALGYVRAQKRVVLRISPEDAEFIQSELQVLQQEFPAIGILDIAPDARLKPGACILESDLGLIDASLDVQLASIRKAFERQLKQGAGEKT